MNKKIVAGLILPMMLWAWGTDIHVWTKDAFPMSYDLVVPNDSEFYVTMRTVLADTGYIHTYTTNNYGTSWNYLTGSSAYSTALARYQPTDIAYYEDTLYIPLFRSGQHIIDFLVQEMHSSGLWSNRYFYLPLDSIQSARLAVAKNSNHTPGAYFYVAALGWLQDTVRYVIMRSTDLGNTWDTINNQYISSTISIERKLKDFSAYDYGDSVKLLLAYEYDDTSSNTYEIYHSTYIDTFGSSTLSRAFFKHFNVAGATNVATSLANSLAIIAYTDTGILKVSYSTDNWTTTTTRDYPYNGDYDDIGDLDMVEWSNFWGSGGFNLAYEARISGYTYIFYDELILNGDTVSFHMPVQVSDTNAYTFIFNLSPYYHLKIANLRDVNSPYIVWNSDYSSYTNPYFHYDSTQFYIDYMGNTPVNEKNATNTGLSNFSVLMHGNLLTLSASNINYNTNVNIMDISGRVVFTKSVKFSNGKAVMDVSHLRNGLYFVVVKNNNTTYHGKFVKIK